MRDTDDTDNTESKTPPSWRAIDPDAILWATWGDDHVAYHRPSGHTHLLNESSRRLITEFLQQPADVESIRRMFGFPADAADAPDDAGETRAMLDRLESLGLIERT